MGLFTSGYKAVRKEQKRQEEWAECSEKERTPGKEFFLSLA